jgi:GTP-binding protein
LPEIAISGRSNVGKSSLINCLANRRNLAKTSQNPGKTQSLNYYLAEQAYYIVDLPGYGYAKMSKEKKKLMAELVNPFLNNRRELMGIIQLIDSRHGPVAGDYDMLKWLKEWDGNVLYVLTKADKLSIQGRMKVKKSFDRDFLLQPAATVRQHREQCGSMASERENSVLFSAHTGMGVDTIRSWIHKTLED